MLFYATPSVTPPRDELAVILQAAGGTLVDAPQGAWDQTLIILGHPDDIKECKRLAKAGHVIYSVEFVLTGILRHEVDYTR